jgi:catechol 2,3-dioxygenase-like lactoylglutathione lyase family enzyme|tara:strand:+ start:42 stop:413 length:372 start_codon:yes stop_codon:yes gene_type:complete
MPRLTRFDHGSIAVGDIDEAVVFYRDVLGLRPLPRPDFGFPGAWFDAGGTAVHLTTDGAQRGPDAPVRPNEAHLAFQVDDPDAMIERLKVNGVNVEELPDSPAARRQVFFNDPWGNMLEMIEF